MRAIRIEGQDVSLNIVSVNGGGNAYSPAGGYGRIAIYYYDSLSTSLTANDYTVLQQVDPNATATPTPTASPTPPPTAEPQEGWVERTYQYEGDAVHAVTSLTSDQSTVFSGTYDENGNMTCRMDASRETWFIQGYNDENRIVSISKLDGPCGTGSILETWAYQYDGDGQRVQEKYFLVATLTSTKAYFMGGLYEVTDNEVANDSVRKYYSIAGQTVAMDDGTGLQYLLTDHLGSVVAVTDANGTLTSQQRYLPFGEVRELPSFARIQETDFGYTGQRSLEGTGLMDYRARFYSAYLMRFIQPDTVIPNPSNPQSWNRFSYTSNNPIRFTDPYGHRECESQDGVECDWKTPFLWNQAETILTRLGGKNDLEAMAQIIEAGTRVYHDFATLLPALSAVFLGVDTSGPGTLLAAALNEYGCAGVGREPHDCPGATEYFGDQGFHPDFQDGYNQLFHLWGYIAETASPGNLAEGLLGQGIAAPANYFHEVVQSNLRKPDNGWGTSWNDYVLSEAGMKIGALITNQSITPTELADVIRNSIGTQGLGSNGALQVLEDRYGILYGTQYHGPP